MKIGITSLYYNNSNYGGVLQAYALTRVINEMGHEAEQIQIKRVFQPVPHKRTLQDYLNIKKYIIRIKIMIIPYIESFYDKIHHDNWELRNIAVSGFRESIPHSERIYTDNDIHEANAYYDVFVTGSDQVWGKMYSESSPYLLNFVNSNKRKFSYAASMGYTQLDEISKKVYSDILKSYDGISVREADAVDMLQPLTSKIVIQCVDPTLLLSKDEWNAITRDAIIKDKYLLCYFLGDDIKLRKLANDYAKAKGLVIVTFPHCPAVHHKSDVGFGDYKVYDADPADFLTYIKFADTVFTDSFHGSVFALIFEKDFYVFNRKGEERMISRIHSLMDMFGMRDRIMSTNVTVKELLQNHKSHQDIMNFERCKSFSLEYIERMVRKK